MSKTNYQAFIPLVSFCRYFPYFSENHPKFKVLALTFWGFVKAVALLFFCFCLIFKIEKSTKNGRKVKPLLFCCFLPHFQNRKIG